MPKALKFQLKLDGLYEQGADLADAVAELIEQQSRLKSTWLGEDEYGMASFYDDRPAVYGLDYSRTSFSSGEIALLDRSDNISEKILVELIGAGLLVDQGVAARGDAEAVAEDRREAEKRARSYFEKIGDPISTTIQKLAEDFEFHFE